MSALTRLKEKNRNARRNRRMETEEKTEKMWEGIGALFLVPVMKQLTIQLPFFKTIQLDEKLQVAAASYGVSMFTSGKVHDAMWGSALGAAGAFSWESEGLLAGLFGK